MDLFNNTFIANNGLNEGGVIKITGMIVNSINCTYINNTSPYGNNIASYPVKIALDIKNNLSNLSSRPPINYLVDGQVTGTPMSETIYFNVLDFYNQIVTTLMNEIAQITLGEYNKSDSIVKDYSFVGKESVIIQKGQFSYDNVTLYSDPPDSILTLIFSTDIIVQDYLKDQSETSLMNLSNIQQEIRPDLSLNIGDMNSTNAYKYLIDVKMRSCIAGEIYNKVSKSCSLCSYKTFSYTPNDTSCTDCPQNAVCLGGTKLMLNPGFWRSDNKTINIHECVPFAPSCM